MEGKRMNQAIDDSSAGQRAVKTVEAVLRDLGWEPQPQDDSASFVVDFDPPYIPVAYAYAAVSISEEIFIFFLNMGFLAPEERRDAVVRFLTLVNASIPLGAFLMDLDDGFLRFRHGTSFEDLELSETMIRNCIRSAMQVLEKFAGGLIHVALRDMDPDAAFAEASRVQ